MATAEELAPREYSYHEPGPWGRAGRAAGRSLASMFLGESFAPVGEMAGGLAHYIGRIFGSGDYKTGVPPKVNSLFKGSAPSAAALTFGENSFRIRHREFLGDVITSSTTGAFDTQNYSFNPGVAATFPWLSQIAAAFQTYRFHGAVVEFRTKSADALNSTNTALGSVVLAADYNANTFSQPFLNKQEMLNYMGSVDCKPSENALMGIECDPDRIPIAQLYIRNGGALAANQDVRMNDLCSFAASTVGFQAASVNIGELYVVYDVEFYMPILAPPGSMALAAEFVLDHTTVTNPGPAPTTSSLFGLVRTTGAASYQTVYDNVGFVLGATTTNGHIGVVDRYTIPSGSTWKIDYIVDGASTATMGRPNVTVVAGTTAPANPIGTIGSPFVSSTDTRATCSWIVQVPDVQQITRAGSVTWTGGTALPFNLFALGATGVAGATNSVPGTPTRAVLRIYQISPTMVNGVSVVVPTV